jgi:hypothetical protein
MKIWKRLRLLSPNKEYSSNDWDEDEAAAEEGQVAE